MNLHAPMSTRSWYLAVTALAALAGLADSLYLTLAHYREVSLSCTIITGCEKVLSSTFSTVGPVPLSALGMAFYCAILVAVFVLYRWQLQQPLVHYAFTAVATAGFAMSLIFILVQVFLIHALCQYCMLSALTSTVIFGCALRITRLTTAPRAGKLE